MTENTALKINLFNAIINFKKHNPQIKKTKTNPFHKSTYADIEDILDAIEIPLYESGLLITHKTYYCDKADAWVFSSTLAHCESGEYETTMRPLKGEKPQEVGSFETYSRRYNMLNLLNLIGGADDDGEATKNIDAGFNRKKPVEKITTTTGAWEKAGFTSLAQARNSFDKAKASVIAITNIDTIIEKEADIKKFIAKVKIWDLQIADDLQNAFDKKRSELESNIPDSTTDLNDNIAY